ncbi:MAG: hypothetical protein R2773_06325 [Flavobacteriaceae bacterium]
MQSVRFLVHGNEAITDMSFNPRLSTVSIIPGMEAFEHTESNKEVFHRPQS